MFTPPGVSADEETDAGADDATAYYLRTYGQHDPVEATAGPRRKPKKKPGPLLTPLAADMPEAPEVPKGPQPQVSDSPLAPHVTRRFPTMAPRDVTATRTSPQSAGVVLDDAQGLRKDLFNQSVAGRLNAAPSDFVDLGVQSFKNAPKILGGMVSETARAYAGDPTANPGQGASDRLRQAVYDARHGDYADAAGGAALVAGEFAMNTLPVLDELGPGMKLAARDLRAGTRAVGRGLDDALEVASKGMQPSGTRVGGRAVRPVGLAGEAGYVGPPAVPSVPDAVAPEAGPLAPQSARAFAPPSGGRAALPLDDLDLEGFLHDTPSDIGSQNPLAPQRGRGNRTGAAGDLESAGRAGESPLKKEAKPPTEETESSPRLSGLHNLSAENLAAADQLGGFPSPSIAVLPEGQPFEDYGDITMIGKRSIFDPAREPVFDADAYTGRSPTPSYPKPGKKVLQDFTDKVSPHFKAMDGQNELDEFSDHLSRGGVDNYAYKFRESNGARAAFLAEQGHDVPAPIRTPRYIGQRDLLESGPVQDFISARGRDTGFEEGSDYHKELTGALQAGVESRAAAIAGEGGGGAEIAARMRESFRDQLDENGLLPYYKASDLMRSAGSLGEDQLDRYATRDALREATAPHTDAYNAWVDQQLEPFKAKPYLNQGGRKVPYTLESATAAATKGPINASERTMTYGPGKARAAAATRLTSLDHARNASGRIKSPADVAEYLAAGKEKESAWRDTMLEKFKGYFESSRSSGANGGRGSSGAWDGLDMMHRGIAEYLEGVMRNGSGPAQFRAVMARKGFPGLSNKVVQQGLDIAKHINEAPVKYFEGKPQRSVGFDEFAGAAIPKSAPAAVRNTLTKRGIPFEEYDEGQRSSVVHALRRRLHEEGHETLGFAHPAVLKPVVASGVGAIAGSFIGATPEERKRNAILGAGIGMAAAAGLPSKLGRAVQTGAGKVGAALEQGFSDIYAPIRESHPELHATLHAAGAMPPISAGRFVGGLTDRALTGLTKGQVELFGKRTLLGNLEAQAQAAERHAKAAAADVAVEDMERPDPTKSGRKLWYSRTTKGGALRRTEEMETEPLVQELQRRADASKVYNADLRRFGPMSVVTQRNEAKIFDIEKILEHRDGLDPDLVWGEIARRRAESVAVTEGDPTDFDFGANASGSSGGSDAPGGDPLVFPKYDPEKPLTETGVRANLLRKAADQFAAHADKLKRTLPQGIEQTPWYKAAAEQVVLQVEGFNEAGAVGSGVNPSSLRRPADGIPYMRLLSQDRVNENLIRQSQRAAFREPGSTTPRPVDTKAARLVKSVMGEHEAVVRGTPPGTTFSPLGPETGPIRRVSQGPPQGPENIARERPAMRNFPPGTSVTGSTITATGDARNYISDFRTAAVMDAADKVAKMQKNSVYKAVAKIPGAEIAPHEDAPTGKRVVTFNDMQQLVTPPSAGSGIPVGFRRFAVPEPVADAIGQFQRQIRGQTGPDRMLKRAAGLVTRSVLLNPAAALGHALTLASGVGAGLPADAGTARALISGLPGVKVLSTLKRMRDVDFTDPGTVERLHRMALSGALRIAADESSGWINKGHHVLFGPSGIDPRARVIASEDFEAGAKRAGITKGDAAYTALERDYITGHAGNYVGRNSGSATQWLQDAGITPFIAINTAKYKTAFGSMAGKGAVKGASAGDRALLAARGALGTAATIKGAGYLLSGHASEDNAVGHEGDLATGVYHLENGEYHMFRGNPDDARTEFGAGAKEVYFRKGMIDPVATAALRLLEPLAYAAPGDKVSEMVRASANAAISLLGPAPAAVAGLWSGKSMYIDPTGALGTLQGVHLQQDVGLVDRLQAVARNVNTAAALTIGSPTPNARSAASALLGNLNPFTEGKAGSIPRLGIERRKVDKWMADVTSRIYRERDPAQRQAIMDAGLEEATRSGYVGPSIRATFQKAVNKAGRPSTGAADRKFQNRIRGGGTP